MEARIINPKIINPSNAKIVATLKEIKREEWIQRQGKQQRKVPVRYRSINSLRFAPQQTQKEKRVKPATKSYFNLVNDPETVFPGVVKE